MTLQKRTLKFSFILLLILCISCDQDDSNTQPILGLPTTFEVISQSEDHIILSNLLEEHGLDEILNEGTYTIFAPDDTAFANVDTSSLTEAEVTNLLLYHVIQGNATTANLSNTYLNTQAKINIEENESQLSVLINNAESIFLNGNAQIIEPDIEASNGTIHVIDQVVGLPKLSTFVNNDPNLAFLLAAISQENQPNYLETLSTHLEDDPAPITLFAPSNEAFTNALSLLGLENLEEIETATLTEIINFHLVTNTNLREIDFTEDSIETLAGNIVYDTENNLIIDDNGRQIEWITRDVQTLNGVLHVVDDVILPESDLQEPVEPVNEVNFTLDNEVNIAYFVTEIDGNEEVTTLSENNSTWTFTIGTRYTINVVNAGTHPLEIRSETNETLLAQSEELEGLFEGDTNVDFSVSGTTFSFTFTQGLANEINSYSCSNHPEMNGVIEVN